MKFEFLTPTTVRLEHLNVRTEKHGDESATAVDLKFTRTSSNDCLERYAPGLLIALYHRAESTERQGELDGIEQPYKNLRFPKLAPLSFDHEQTGCTLTIDYGLGGASSLVMGSCKVNKHRVECAEGGSVTESWRVQTSDLPEGALDKLSKLLAGETQILLALPEDKPAQAPIDGTVGHPGVASLEKARKEKKGDVDKDATQLFTEAHAG